MPHLFYSYALNRRQICYVLLPERYEEDTEKRYPVIYLLHGRNGMELDWMVHGRAEETVADMTAGGQLRESIVVMPNDGGHNRGTFYANWYEGRHCQFEDYMVHDLVGFIDRTFRTLNDRRGRVLAGDSMGGYGSVMLAFRHPELFGAAASLSGNMQVLETVDHDEAAPMFGPPQGEYALQYDLSRLAEKVLPLPDRPSLYFDCGVDDFLFRTNEHFHGRLLQIGYPHTYRRFPGDHTWAYWREHLRDALQFFESEFRKHDGNNAEGSI